MKEERLAFAAFRKEAHSPYKSLSLWEYCAARSVLPANCASHARYLQYRALKYNVTLGSERWEDCTA